VTLASEPESLASFTAVMEPFPTVMPVNPLPAPEKLEAVTVPETLSAPAMFTFREASHWSAMFVVAPLVPKAPPPLP